MSDTLTFAELDGQQVELLPARTVLSLFELGGDGGAGGTAGDGDHGGNGGLAFAGSQFALFGDNNVSADGGAGGDGGSADGGAGGDVDIDD